jgi:hypothetical protein
MSISIAYPVKLTTLQSLFPHENNIGYTGIQYMKQHYFQRILIPKICQLLCGICSYERSGTVITLFKPEMLVISVHIDHTSYTGNNQYNFNY